MTTLNKTIAAMKAARDILSDKITVPAAASRYDVDRTIIRNTMIILTNGTPEEIAAAWEGKSSSKEMAEQIRSRMTPEQLYAYRTVRLNHATRKATLPLELELWAKFGPALRTLTEFPNAKETIALLARNRMRIKIIDANLETATQWLEEFANEWRRYKNDKSKNRATNSGGSDPDAGAQHLKPTAK